MGKYYLNGYQTPDGISSRDDVRSAQSQINEYLGSGLKTDGIWGPKTQAAYERYLALQQPAYSGGGGGSSSSAFKQAAADYKRAQDAAYENAKVSNQAQAAKLSDQYNNTRSQVYTNARLNAIGNNEAYASMGLAGNMYSAAASGASETARTQENIGMRNGINEATRQEGGAKDDLARQLIEAGLTRDQNYANYLADIGMKKAEYAQEMAMLQAQIDAQMQQLAMKGGIAGGGSKSRSGGRSMGDGYTLAQLALDSSPTLFMALEDLNKYSNGYSRDAIGLAQSVLSAEMASTNPQNQLWNYLEPAGKRYQSVKRDTR